MADTVTPDSHEAAVVKETLLSLQAHQAILEHENNGLRYALGRKQRDYETPINALDVQTNRDNHSRALLLSPRTIRHATDRRMENEREMEEEKRNRLRTKELKAEAKLIAEEQARMKREERVKEKERKKKEKAAKAAQVIKDCEARNALKAIQTSQSSKRKALKPAAKQQLKKRRVGGARGGAMAEVPAPAPPPILTRRGRTVNTLAKFR
ncbi:hypothetical protein PTMSG1_10536 [Pyrenophora teres f. maculata]|nr:hypothetical protein PTMSG1_10536 [Pyrenophora teres f. maculata]